MKNIILYILFRTFSLAIQILPESISAKLGTGFGLFAHKVTKDRRELARDNFKKAFGDRYSEEKVKEIIKEVYKNIGLILVEFILLKKLNEDNINNYIQLKGENYLQEAFEREKGVIIYGAHFGNWEWMGAVISLLGYPLNAIARDQNNGFFNEKINEIREGTGVNVISKGISVRKAYRFLKKGQCVLILGDQDAGKDGWQTDFFDRPASTYSGAVKLAQRTGASIVPGFMIRNKFSRFNLEFYPGYQVPEEADHEKQKEILQKLVDKTEEVVTEYPSQWLWLHQRWKTY